MKGLFSLILIVFYLVSIHASLSIHFIPVLTVQALISSADLARLSKNLVILFIQAFFILNSSMCGDNLRSQLMINFSLLSCSEN